MVNRSSAKGKKRKVEQEEWSPSKSHCLRGQQIVRARGRPNYSEASNSDDDCLMIDEESSSTQPEGVASSPGTLSDADIRLAIQIALLYQSQSSKIFKSFPIEVNPDLTHHQFHIYLLQPFLAIQSSSVHLSLHFSSTPLAP
jgi:hypothetical protein